MANKIPCGGFYYDENTLKVDSGVLSALIPSAPTVDQIYNPDSENAQSGKAVAGAISNKQDTLTAGDNISIAEGNIISATGDTEYSATSLAPQSGVAVAKAVGAKAPYIIDNVALTLEQLQEVISAVFTEHRQVIYISGDNCFVYSAIFFTNQQQYLVMIRSNFSSAGVLTITRDNYTVATAARSSTKWTFQGTQA